MEFTCRSSQDNSYKIILEWNAVDRILEILQQELLIDSFYIISDSTVFRHQGRRLQSALGSRSHPFLVPPGETSKSLRQWHKIQDFLVRSGADRRSVLLAFGGGVVGDLTGFAASTYMRGLRFVQIPTTILSQSDSSIGAKVAVNHPKAKNLIGSFYQPRLVITDPSLLQSLPRREFSAGLGEAIKYGVIADPSILDLLDQHMERILAGDQELLTDLISRCIQIKIRVVEQDERETGLRKILNFGHTIGHALEQATGFRRLRHGEAVGWGMLAAGYLGVKNHLWSESEFEQLQSVIFRSGVLYPLGKLRPESILHALKHDKKKTGKSLNFVLPVRMGEVKIVSDIPQPDVLEAIKFMMKTGTTNMKNRKSKIKNAN